MSLTCPSELETNSREIDAVLGNWPDSKSRARRSGLGKRAGLDEDLAGGWLTRQS